MDMAKPLRAGSVTCIRDIRTQIRTLNPGPPHHTYISHCSGAQGDDCRTSKGLDHSKEDQGAEISGKRRHEDISNEINGQGYDVKRSPPLPVRKSGPKERGESAKSHEDRYGGVRGGAAYPEVLFQHRQGREVDASGQRAQEAGRADQSNDEALPGRGKARVWCGGLAIMLLLFVCSPHTFNTGGQIGEWK
jgi:hypothetical protein